MGGLFLAAMGGEVDVLVLCASVGELPLGLARGGFPGGAGGGVKVGAGGRLLGDGDDVEVRSDDGLLCSHDSSVSSKARFVVGGGLGDSEWENTARMGKPVAGLILGTEYSSPPRKAVSQGIEADIVSNSWIANVVGSRTDMWREEPAAEENTFALLSDLARDAVPKALERLGEPGRCLDLGAADGDGILPPTILAALGNSSRPPVDTKTSLSDETDDWLAIDGRDGDFPSSLPCPVLGVMTGLESGGRYDGRGGALLEGGLYGRGGGGGRLLLLWLVSASFV